MGPIQRHDITGLILAGGRGSRMGGIDKGLAPLRGARLVDHVLARLQGQVGPVLISANRHADAYAALGCPVVADLQADYSGPLAGVAAALRQCSTPWLLCVPCDVPDFPVDLAQALAQALQASPHRLALAATRAPDGSTQLEPAFMLLHHSLAESIEQALAQQVHAIRAWARSVGYVTTTFSDASAFRNANTPQELQALQAAP